MPRQMIFIMTDTQRWDMLGCYGNEAMVTPCLDGLAHEGIHIAYIGKWHLDGGDYFGKGVCPDGWDAKYWYDMRCYLEELSEEDRVRSRHPETVREGCAEQFTYGYRCSERAMQFLEEHKDEDFFLVVSYDEPHDPCLAPEKFADMYEEYELSDRENFYDPLDNKPEHHRLWARQALTEDRMGGYRRREPLFFGCNSFADEQIGRVLDAWKEYAPDALVMYTSDHGDMLG